MRILFLPFAAKGETPGFLTRALSRDLAARIARTSEVETVFRPYVHMVEGKRVFGVYANRWSGEDLARMVAEDPPPDLVVHGDLGGGDPISMTVEVLSAPDLETVAEETFEAPAFRGFDVVESAARVVLEAAGVPSDPPGLADFPARTFEGFLLLLEGREAAAGLDAWGDTAEPGAAFDPFLGALEREPGMEAAKKELCLLAASAALGGSAPLDAAERAVRTLLERDRRQWRGWAALAQVLIAKDEPDQAAEAFRKALEIEPGRASLRYDLGMTYLRQGRTSRAAKALETVKSDPRFGGGALLELGIIRASKKDLDGAVALWRESIDLDPERAVTYANLGSALASRGEFEEADEVFRRGLSARRPSFALHLAWGTHLADQDRCAEAILELRAALRLRPEVPEAHLHLGRCLAAEGRKGPALHYLRKALRGPESVAERAREAIRDIGSLAHEEALVESLAEAVERPAEEQLVLLKSLLKEESGFAEARIRLGLALIAVQKGRAAEGQLRKVLKAHPDDPEAWSGLATALRTRGKLKAAVEAHREAIERAPGHASFYLNLADTLLCLGRIREATREIDVARSLEPHHPLLADFTQAAKRQISDELERGLETNE